MCSERYLKWRVVWHVLKCYNTIAVSFLFHLRATVSLSRLWRLLVASFRCAAWEFESTDAICLPVYTDLAPERHPNPRRANAYIPITQPNPTQPNSFRNTRLFRTFVWYGALQVVTLTPLLSPKVRKRNACTGLRILFSVYSWFSFSSSSSTFIIPCYFRPSVLTHFVYMVSSYLPINSNVLNCIICSYFLTCFSSFLSCLIASSVLLLYLLFFISLCFPMSMSHCSALWLVYLLPCTYSLKLCDHNSYTFSVRWEGPKMFQAKLQVANEMNMPA
jgi:hypothetical protein